MLPAVVPASSADALGATRAGPSVEQGVYALLFLLALGLRLYGLGTLNLLSPWEAAQVWPAWLGNNAAQLPVSVAPVSPLLFTLQRSLFLLTGDGNEFWARFAPACAGAGMVLAAWALRRPMGRGGALAVAVLFALDPWLLAFSRLGDSAILSALTGVLLLTRLFDGAADASLSTRQIDRLAVIAGLFLISGPLTWLLLPLILFAILLLNGGPLSRFSRGDGGRAAVVFVATIVVGSTGLLAHISGLAAIGESLGAAIAHLTAGDSPYPLNWGLLRLLVDEPFLVLFGGSGLVIALLKMQNHRGEDDEALLQHVWLRVLAGGVGWGLLCLLLPGRTPVSLLVLGLPLLLLAAATATSLLRFGLSRPLHQIEAAPPALATMGILLVTAFFWTGNTTAALRDGNYDPRLTAFYLLIPALGAFFVWWSGARASGQVFGLLALAVFFLANASSSWMLNLRPEASHSRSLFAETADNGLALLLDDVARLSSLRAGDPTEAPVYLLVGPQLQPFLAWHLRAMRHVRWPASIEASDGAISHPPDIVAPFDSALDEHALIVSEPGFGQAPLRLPDDFIGSSYSVTQHWLPTDLIDVGPRLRWTLYRERQQMPTRQTVELWVKRE